MPSIVQAINDFKFDLNFDECLEYLKERENVRLLKKQGKPQPWTNDPIIANSKFLNVFREHDAVSEIINDLAPSKDLIYEYVYIARLVNHREHLPWLFSSYDWLESKEGVSAKLEEFIDRGDTVCNPGAYQINPRIGFKYGHRNIRDAMKYVVPERMEHVVEAMKSTTQLDEATDKANKAFGGFTNFWMFQAAIDVAWIYPDIMERDSHPYYGSGSKNAEGQTDELQAYINANKPDNWRYFYRFDVENALCEYRKYKMRQAKGIPSNRQYKVKLL